MKNDPAAPMIAPARSPMMKAAVIGENNRVYPERSRRVDDCPLSYVQSNETKKKKDSKETIRQMFISLNVLDLKEKVPFHLDFLLSMIIL